MKIIKNSNEISSFLSRLDFPKHQFYTWRIQGGDVYKIEVKTITSLAKNQEMSLEFHSPKDMEFFVSSQDYVNLFCPDESIIMRMKLVKISSENLLRCAWPETLAIVDRRKKTREDFSNYDQVYIDIPTMNIVKKNLYDLSFNGLSFIITKDERRYLKQDEEFFFQLNVSDTKFKLIGEIVYVKEIPRDHHENFMYGGIKVGVHIKKHQDKFLEWLQKIIQ